METEERVVVSGASLSEALRVFHTHQGDCEGVLVGKVSTRRFAPILQDNMANAETSVHTLIYVSHFLVTGSPFSFYNAQGELTQSPESIMQRHGRESSGPAESVVGYFKFRRGSSLRPSFREQMVYESLCAGRKPPLVLFLATGGPAPASAGGAACHGLQGPGHSLATHNVTYCVSRSTQEGFKNLRLQINTLEIAPIAAYNQVHSHVGEESSLHAQTHASLAPLLARTSGVRVSSVVRALEDAVERMIEEMKSKAAAVAQAEAACSALEQQR